MEYITLEEFGVLEVEYDGPSLDLIAMGTMELEFQAMCDRVALALLARSGLIEVPQPWLLYRRPAPFIRARPAGPLGTDDTRPVRLLIRKVRSESPLKQELAIAVALVFSDPNARAVLLGIASNIITGIGATGLRGLRKLFRSQENDLEHIVDIGPHVRSLAATLARNANGQKATLRVTYARGNERFGVELEIDSREN